jgi:protein gp37
MKKSCRRRSSSCDTLFDKQVPVPWRRDLWHLIEQTPHLDWLLLTKRPQNIAKMLPDPETGVRPWGDGWPNVWLGTTAEDGESFRQRWLHLALIPCVVRFVSYEPALGDLAEALAHMGAGTLPDWRRERAALPSAECGPRASGARCLRTSRHGVPL